MTDPLTILIADDHPMIRHGLREAIEANDAWQIVGEAEDGVRALELIVQLRPTIAILDISMPGKNGFDVVESIRQKNSPTHVSQTREVGQSTVGDEHPDAAVRSSVCTIT